MKYFGSFKVTFFFLILGMLWLLNTNEIHAAVNISDTEYYTVDTKRTTDTDVYITVSLSTANSAYYKNYTKILNALEAADPNEKYTLHIQLTKGNAIFPIGYSSSDRPYGTLNIRSMTEIDLGGNTLLATKNMITKEGGTNIFSNCDKNGNRKNDAKQGISGVKGGYDLSHDIVLKNGIIDGNKGTKSEVNLITFGHARGITVMDVTFLHNGSNHLLEFNGCKDVKVSNCIFDGYLFQETKDEYDIYLSKEALEIDIAGKGEEWAAAFDGDDTVCENVTVTGCTFKDYPCGVGDHHSIAGKHTKNIEISNNRFLYSKSTVSGCAIRTFAFDDCKIINNTINGNYAIPIRVYGGKTVTVSDNTISKAKEDGILLAFSTYTQNRATKNEAVSRATISNNTIKATGRGIYVHEKASVSYIINNKITSNGTGISFAEKSALTNLISQNVVTSKKDSGISVTDSTVGTISANTITGNNRGIYVAEGAVVLSIGGKKADANAIYSTKGDGICATDKNTRITTVKYNVINKGFTTNGIGIRIVKNAYIKNIENNSIYASQTNNTGVGIAVASAKNTAIKGNSISAGYRGIIVTSTGQVSSVRSNKVTAKKDSALYVATGGKITTVGGKKYGNTFKSRKKETIIISGNKTSVRELSYNTITSPAVSTCSSLKIASKAKVVTISNNTIDTSGAAGGTGINIFGGTVSKIIGNKITAGLRGIIVTSKGKVDSICKNKVVVTKDNALIVCSKGYAGTVGGKAANKNTFTSKQKAGVNVNGSGSQIKVLSYNTISAQNKKNGYGVWIYKGGKINKIASNKITAGKEEIKK
ncbi:MAG: hypothetical protein HFI88_04660 [Lachnospiraceae bacterium]|nr:hypothetical protein [Lachnospiraceae bacterium]